MMVAPSVHRKPCNSSMSARSRARKQRWCRPTRCCANAAAGVLGRRRADPDRGAAADAVERRLGIDDGLHAEKRQQLAIERAGAFEIRCGQKNMRDAVDLHRPPLSPQNDVGLNFRPHAHACVSSRAIPVAPYTSCTFAIPDRCGNGDTRRGERRCAAPPPVADASGRGLRSRRFKSRGGFEHVN